MKFLALILSLMICVPSYAKIIKITNDKQFTAEMKKPGPRAVLFSATWCPGCQQFHPIYKKLASQMSIRFYEIDVDTPGLQQTLETLHLPYIPFVAVANSETDFWLNPCVPHPEVRDQDHETIEILKCIQKGL